MDFDSVKKKLWNFRNKNAAYFFIAPFFIFLIAFYIFPIVYSIFLGFTKWTFGSYSLTGFSNYFKLFHDHLFYRSLWNSTFYVITTLLIVLPVALGIALLLHNSAYKKIGSLMQKLIYIPSITPVIAIGIIFTLLYEKNSGLFNAILQTLNLPGISWTSSVKLAKWSILAVIMWRWAGYNAVYYIGGLEGIPQSLYEAADVDGANAFHKFIYITLPMLKPIILFTVVTSIIGSYMLFAEIFVITGGGPENSSISMVQYIYRQGFSFFNFGFASAATNVLFLFIFAIAFTVMTSFGLWEEWR